MRASTYKIPTPSESLEQQYLIRWAHMRSVEYPELDLIFHIPNEGKRSVKNGARLRAEGLKSGVPDLFLPVARNGKNGFFIEMKKRDGRTSGNQDKWLESLSDQGYQTMVAFGWEQAARAIMLYMTGTEEI